MIEIAQFDFRALFSQIVWWSALWKMMCKETEEFLYGENETR